MSLHTLTIDDQAAVDVFTNAVPPIVAGSALYIQNVSSFKVFISDDVGMANKFVIGDMDDAPSISTMSISAGSTAFAIADGYKAVLTIEVV